MTDSPVTDRVISQGRALVRAIEAMTEIEPSGWFERALARLHCSEILKRFPESPAAADAKALLATLGRPAGEPGKTE